VSRPQVTGDEEHERGHDKVAAIDVAKDAGVVCARTPHPSRPGARRSAIWTVKARMNTIRALGRQLRKDGIEIVTLESTSDYWRIWFFVLEACGLAVQLDGAAQAKNLPGRPKTDPLTELPGVFAAHTWCASQQPIAGMPERSESSGRRGLIVSPIATETGHTRVNRSPAFSSLPIFDVSRSPP
jgi:hypothetical protein